MLNRQGLGAARISSRCWRTLTRTSSKVPWRSSVFSARLALPHAFDEISGSACWQVSPGLVQTLPGSEVKVARIHLPLVDCVARKGSSTGRDLLYQVTPSSFFQCVGVRPARSRKRDSGGEANPSGAWSGGRVFPKRAGQNHPYGRHRSAAGGHRGNREKSC